MIPLSDQPLPAWRFDGFRVERARNELAGIEALSEWPCDAAVLVADADVERAAQVSSELEQDFQADLPALLIATDSRVVMPPSSLSRINADGVLDVAWPETLARECLELVVGRVRAGRGVAGIQNELFQAVSRDVAILKNLSIRDELTGLFNLRHFREIAAREHLRCRRHGRTYALALCDLDNLRTLNNTFGHAVGTRALLQFARAIEANTRDCDCAFRIGGDEFVTLLVEADASSALAYAERVRKSFKESVLIEEGVQIPLSISIGVAAFPGGGETPDQLLKAADAALYRAKSLGRDRIAVHAEQGRGSL